MIPTEDPVRLLHGPNMTNKTFYGMAHPPWKVLVEKAKTMDLWTKETEPAYCSEVHEHDDELIDYEMWNSFNPQEEPLDGLIRDGMICSKVEKFMEHTENAPMKSL